MSWDEYADGLLEFTCEECGHTWRQFPERSYENSDADGNRGIWVSWVICPECEEEYGMI